MRAGGLWRCPGIRAVVLAQLAGCSFLFVRSPEPNVARRDQTCTTHYVAPVIDTVYGAALLIPPIGAASSALSADDDSGPEGDLKLFEGVDGDIALIAGFSAAFYALSAVFGYADVHACRALPAD